MTAISRRRRPDLAQRPPANDPLLHEPSLIEELERDPIEAQELAAARLALTVRVALRTALERSGLKAADLAVALDISESAVSQVMNGDGNLRIATIGKYARALGYQACLHMEPAQQHLSALDLRFPFCERRSSLPSHWRLLKLPDESTWIAESNVLSSSVGRLVVKTVFTEHESAPEVSTVPPASQPLLPELKASAPNSSMAISA